MTRQRISYLAMNALFHSLHLGIIAFVMIGWLFNALLPWHLALVLVMMGCWFSMGGCPVSDWHWNIKEKLGGGRPDATYIRFVLQNLSGKAFNPVAVDKTVLAITVVIVAVSLCLNVWRVLH